jgi:hypothetical protein
MNHDVAERGEITPANLVALPVVPVEDVRGPAVALDHDRGADDQEVDRVLADRSVELDGGKQVPAASRANAGSRMLSGGLPSRLQDCSAVRRAGTPGRPFRG